MEGSRDSNVLRLVSLLIDQKKWYYMRYAVLIERFRVDEGYAVIIDFSS